MAEGRGQRTESKNQVKESRSREVEKTPSHSPRTFFAPAKVNLGLSVLGVRPNGYHDLHSLMVPLSVGDELEITPADTLSLRVVGADLPTDERNLVYRAAKMYLDAAGVEVGAQIVLHKQLPLASGMGGGSSDAATTLMALAELYPAKVDLPALALKLGADVPFFLLRSAALAEGVGEKLTPLDVPSVPLVLLNPGVEVSARDAYLWLDEAAGFTPELDVKGIISALREGAAVPYFNALQAEVVRRHPPIAEALRLLSDAGLHSPLMSGSGSTCFALADTPEQAQAAVRALKEVKPGWWAVAAQVQPKMSR